MTAPEGRESSGEIMTAERAAAEQGAADPSLPTYVKPSTLTRSTISVMRVWPPLAMLVVFFGSWELLVRSMDVAVIYVPAPSMIVAYVIDNIDLYVGHAIVTLQQAGWGLLLGSSFALVIAIIMSEFQLMHRALLPLMVIIKVTPSVTLIPVLVIMLGMGQAPKIIVAALTLYYAVMINAVAGFKYVDEAAYEVLKSVNASRLEIFVRLRLPNSLPHLFSAAKIGLPLAVLGVIFAEMYNSREGLGNVLIQAGHNVNMVRMWGAIYVLSFIGVVLVTSAGLLERRMLRWHSSTGI